MKKFISAWLAALLMFASVSAVHAANAYPYAIEPQFRWVSDFKDGFAEYSTVDGKKGFIDKAGKMSVIPSEILENVNTFPHADGMMKVYHKETNKCGYLNAEGKLAIEMKYDTCFDFSEGMAAVGVNGKLGFIDKSGREVVKPQYDFVHEFREGMAVVCVEPKLDPGTYFSLDDYNCGYINANGKLVVPLETKHYYAHDFSDGLGQMDTTFYDKNGNVAFRWKNNIFITSFYNGAAIAGVPGGLGLVDKTGKQISKAYDEIYNFRDGMAVVLKGNKFGYIDLKGREVVPPKYDSAFNFIDGTARVLEFSRQGNEITTITTILIDKSGKELARSKTNKVIMAYYHDYINRDEDRLLFPAINEEEKVGIVNRLGEVVIPYIYDSAYFISEDYLKTVKDGKFGFIHKSGYEIKPQFKAVNGFVEGMAAVQDAETGLWGFIASPFATAKPNTSKLLVDGKEMIMQAYNINGNNYFKLRDLAMALNGTAKSFAIEWDGSAGAITLVPEKPYTSIGGELAVSDRPSETEAVLSVSPIYLNENPVSIYPYLINGNNYFKLRDIAKLINFGVIWNPAAKTIEIDTSKNYVEN